MISNEPISIVTAKELARELELQVSSHQARSPKPKDVAGVPAARELMAADELTQIMFVRVTIARIGSLGRALGAPRDNNDFRYLNLHLRDGYPRAGGVLISQIMRRRLGFAEKDLTAMLHDTAESARISTRGHAYLPQLITLVEEHLNGGILTVGMRDELRCVAHALEWITNAPERKLRERIDRLCEGPMELPLFPGEAWSDQAIQDINALRPLPKQAWVALLKHCARATSSAPSPRWRDGAESAVGRVGRGEFRRRILRWFPLVNKPRAQAVSQGSPWLPDPNDMIIEPHMDMLRGLAWAATFVAHHEIIRALGALAKSAYRKVPLAGPRAVRVGNACIYALRTIGNETALAQLAMLKVRVKFGTAQKEIEKAFNAAAQKLNVPRDQIEEMGVPSYGLEEVGLHRESFGDYRAELTVTGSEAELYWFDEKGKSIKSVPAKVKQDHKDDLKDLQQSLKDIQAMLPAQRDRIDSMFLLEKKWPIETWRERYLNHPLVGTIAQRMIWCVDGTPAVFIDGIATDLEGKPVNHGTASEITLWHPVGQSIDAITACRRRLEALGITQPFKQAHREVYLLTDAERRTNTYSNRFAAHVIRQHQFNALCAARGWKNKLRLLVDDEYPPAMKLLTRWGLRAEFWIEGIGEDTNDSGVFLRLATDQVRFYRVEAQQNLAHAGGGGYGAGHRQTPAEPVPLEQVPLLVFSEIMRDVDLFVAVASVGNDPNWSDGGPEGRFRNYWHSYSFGDLGESAKTRREVLQRLIPRLKIADRCSFSDKFLIVRGQKRTYKIHLGSGNILMEPNDQYLCIVPDARARTSAENLFLPFEGDSTLSIILSKALLLAEDAKIKDPTITRQIER